MDEFVRPVYSVSDNESNLPVMKPFDVPANVLESEVLTTLIKISPAELAVLTSSISSIDVISIKDLG